MREKIRHTADSVTAQTLKVEQKALITHMMINTESDSYFMCNQLQLHF
jgi:hypothetical protein